MRQTKTLYIKVMLLRYFSAITYLHLKYLFNKIEYLSRNGIET